ncbi:unnamed protein product, partial [Ilex paraguariensis]
DPFTSTNSQKVALTSTSQGVSPPLIEGSSGCVGASSSPSSMEVAGALEAKLLSCKGFPLPGLLRRLLAYVWRVYR